MQKIYMVDQKYTIIYSILQTEGVSIQGKYGALHSSRSRPKVEADGQKLGLDLDECNAPDFP